MMFLHAKFPTDVTITNSIEYTVILTAAVITVLFTKK